MRRQSGFSVRLPLLCLLAMAILAAQVPSKVDFAQDVQPIFREHCVECHGPAQQMRGLRLDRRRDAMPNRVGANRARIVPGDSARSSVYLRVSGTNAGAQMPPAGPLRPEQVNTIKNWIEQGAHWPDSAADARLSAPPDPGVLTIMNALRNGNRGDFQRALRRHPGSIDRPGEGGWTPLMYAAFYGDSQSVRALLDKGAKPDVQNLEGGTALMYAVDDPEKTRMLLERGADPNIRSGEGRTALLIAAGGIGTTATVKLLLDKGADPAVRLPEGRSALALAVGGGNEDLVALLLERGVDKKQLPLNAAAFTRCTPCFDLLVKFAGPGDLTAALDGAVASGDLALVRRLLDIGANANANTLQFAAVSPVTIPSDILKILISRGADLKVKTPSGVSLAAFSRRQGKPGLVELLTAAGAANDNSEPLHVKPKPAASIREAISRSVPALQRADVSFLDKAGCVSCHNNSLTAMTIAAARAKGVRVNEQTAKDQLRRIAAFLQENRERALENAGLPGGIDTVSYILLGMVAERYPADTLTDAWAHYLKRRQSPNGSWQCLTMVRPPLESSDFQVTAASIRALRSYGPNSRRAEYDTAVRRGTQWLVTARPLTTEDHAYKLLGLVWGGGNADAVRAAAQQLLALQRSDGGWGQTSNLASDAYATGQALVALRESRIVNVNNAAYRRGVQHLMQSQLEDGSWYVQTRSFPLQPHFDSDFPHGLDQFISAAATNWATMALTAALE